MVGFFSFQFTGLIALAAMQADVGPWRAGEPLRELEAPQQARFEFGRVQYAREFDASEGLGPTTNNTSCGACHFKPVGGWGEQRVTRYGFMSEDGQFSPIDPGGDTLWQHVGVTGVDDCREVIPNESNHFSLRVTTGATGYGLIEAIPDQALLAVRDLQPPDIRGIERWVDSIDSAPGDPARIGRFGWKAQEATVLAFSADAASAEMGVTTWLVQQEPAPNGDMELLDACDDVPDPETGVEVEGFDYLGAVTDFQRFMAPPPRIPASGMAGEAIMDTIGCTACHVPTLMTGSQLELEDALRNKPVHAYSDFLLHDMGEAGDGIQDGPVEETWMRTSPLWGLAIQPTSWHDGRCAQLNSADRIRCAISEHAAAGSQAVNSATAFASLPQQEQDLLIEFLLSLGRRPFDADRDGVVLRSDLQGESSGFLSCFGSSPGPDDPCTVHDHDGDGQVDEGDLDMLPAAWDDIETDCNANGQWDVRDLVLGVSQDLDGNGIPDECTTCLGDLDFDGDVDVNDILGLISEGWGCQGSCAGDLDGSGLVDSTDVLLMIALWGPCSG